MRGLLIDVENKAVTEVNVNDLPDMYPLIDCDLVERVQVDDGVDLWIDESGLCKDRTKGFIIGGQTFMGNAILMGEDKRKRKMVDLPPAITIDAAQKVVLFIDYDDPAMAPQPHIQVITFSGEDE
jgi:hypothetical protein